MPLQLSARASKKPLRLDDEVRFLRSWIEKPLHMGAVMPSGRILARTMAQYVDVKSVDPVIELGPGTGAITNALIEHGVDQKKLNTLRTLSSGHGIELGFFSRVRNHMNPNVEPGFPKVIL